MHLEYVDASAAKGLQVEILHPNSTGSSLTSPGPCQPRDFAKLTYSYNECVQVIYSVPGQDLFSAQTFRPRCANDFLCLRLSK